MFRRQSQRGEGWDRRTVCRSCAVRRAESLPRSLIQLLDGFRPCFTSGAFDTFVALVSGLIAALTRRTVCGMLTAAGMSTAWHHSRAHRFFVSTRWSLDQLRLTLLGLVIGWLVPAGAPVVVAVDDTLFRRRGRKVHAAVWAYDGSRDVAAGEKKLSRGTTFVVAAVVVELPFLARPIALPVLARLWRPGGPTKTTLARQLIGMLANARPDLAQISVHLDGGGRVGASRMFGRARWLWHARPLGGRWTGPYPHHMTGFSG